MWHATPGLTVDRDPGRVSLLHSVSHYASRMGRPLCCWDDENFANRGDMTYCTAPLAQWDLAYLHLAPVVHILSETVINTTIARDLDLKMLGTLRSGRRGG